MMIPVTANEGHVFVEEGDDIQHMLILEEGVLVRKKHGFDDPIQIKEFRKSLKEEKQLKGDETSVIVDEICGRGRVTGMLHILQHIPLQCLKTMYIFIHVYRKISLKSRKAR